MNAKEKQNKTRQGALRQGLAAVQLLRELSPNLPIPQAEILLLLGANGGEMYMSDLRRATGLTGASLSRNVYNLSDLSWRKVRGLGMVTIEPDPADIRTKIVRLNRAGKAFLKELEVALS